MRINNTVVAVPTFGNFLFTKLTIEHIIKTTKKVDYTLFVVVGDKNDKNTIKYCKRNSIDYVVHDINKGLPGSINDIYDYAFKDNSFDSVTIVGNDVLAFWNSIDQLIDEANSTDYDWISGVAVPINVLIKAVPECKKYFHGGEKDKNFNGTSLPEWLDKFKFTEKENRILDLKRHSIVGDSHNMCVFTKKVFDVVGYVDVNCYPAYFEDNDYSRRAQLLGIKMCRVANARYFHFWSRTIHQGPDGASDNKFFDNTKDFYKEKWGDLPGKEVYKVPFNGRAYSYNNVKAKGHLNIASRKREIMIINYWKSKHG